jgi:DNA-binding MarR family transcriptional regulator
LRERQRVARKTELATGLAAAQTFVLNAVDGAPGCSLNGIAAPTMTDCTSVAAIERLVEDLYVTRSRAEDDRRRASLTIAACGRRAIRKAAPLPTKRLVDALRALSAADRDALVRGLTALSNRMGVGDQPAGMLFEESGA